MTPRARALVAVLLAASLATLYVPLDRVPLLFDSLGYTAQALNLALDDSNTVSLGVSEQVGMYPIGVPILASIPLRLPGDDLRRAVWAILACGLACVIATWSLARRLGGISAGLAAALLVLASPSFRGASSTVLSQVPSALAMVAMLCLFARGTRLGLVGAGALSGVSVLLRYANGGSCLALLLAAMFFGSRTMSTRLRRVGWVLLGLIPAALLVAWHNDFFYGGPLRTGYDVWGWGRYRLSWEHLLQTPPGVGSSEAWPLARSMVGLGTLYSLPVFLLACVGLGVLVKRRRDAPGVMPAIVLVISGQVLVHALYAFHSVLYLVPVVPLVAVLAGLGGVACLRRLGATSEVWAPMLANVALLASLSQQRALSPGERHAVDVYETLRAANRSVEADAVLITATDPPLVEPVFRTQSRREVLYVRSYLGFRLLEDLPEQLLGAPVVTPRRVRSFVRGKLLAGRPVYYHHSAAPGAGKLPARSIQADLSAAFELRPTGVADLYEVVPREPLSRSAPGDSFEQQPTPGRKSDADPGTDPDGR